MNLTERLNKLINNLPDLSGVYMFKDGKGDIIYVGKAKSLNKRVRNHFQRPAEPRNRVMVRKVEDIDYLVTKNETEALILEYNLIKKEKPKYNVLYRDDKSYPYIAVTVADRWPRIILTRDTNIRGARYFGPYPKAYAAKKVLNSLIKLFPLRSCRGKKPGKRRNTPCLLFDIHKCSGPCVDAVSEKTYRMYVKQILDFLDGKSDKFISKLEEKMYKAAEKMEYEKAASFREKVQSALYVRSHQRAIVEKEIDVDVFGYFFSEEVYIRILRIRSGKLVGSHGTVFETNNVSRALYRSFMTYYSRNREIPPEIVIPEHFKGQDEVKSFLRNETGKKIKITVPEKGFKLELLDFARENAAQSFYRFKYQSRAGYRRTEDDLNQLKEALSMKKAPLRIECFDLSGSHGESSVGSMVVFEEGVPKRNHYRKFKIRGRPDSDVDMMREVLKRRFSKLNKSRDPSFKKIPDLVILDGGKPQLSAAVKTLKELGLYKDIDLAAVAKKEENVFIPGKKEPLNLNKKSQALKLVQNVRDEGHRVAVMYYRNLEEKKMRASVLDTIKGIGPVRKKRLLSQFGGIKEISTVSIDELSKVIPRDVAARVKEKLKV